MNKILLAACFAPLVAGETGLAVAVWPLSEQFQITEMKYRVMYNSMNRKTLPMDGYDIRSSMADELVAVAAKGSSSWNPVTVTDSAALEALWKGKGSCPAGVTGNRLVVSRIDFHGAFVTTLRKDKFVLAQELRVFDCKSRKRVWKKRLVEMSDLPDKFERLQGEGQRPIKEGMNALVERSAAVLVAELAKSGHAR